MSPELEREDDRVLDGDRGFEYVEYDNTGLPLRLFTTPVVRSVALAEAELRQMGAESSTALAHLAHMGLNINVTGYKSQPDNTDEWAYFAFRARIPTQWDRRRFGISPVIEVGKPWRRGLGVAVRDGRGLTHIYGLWVPTWGPRRFRIDHLDTGRRDISPEELLRHDRPS